jgi:hypothetical protein
VLLLGLLTQRICMKTFLSLNFLGSALPMFSYFLLNTAQGRPVPDWLSLALELHGLLSA